MGQPPSWLLRRGAALLLGAFVFLLLGAALFRYPDALTAPALLVTASPPVELTSPAQTYLEAKLLSDGAHVRTGDVLGMLANTASLEEVALLVRWLDDPYFPLPSNLQVGDLQPLYARLCSELDALQEAKADQAKAALRSSLQDQVRQLKNRIGYLTQDLALLAQEIAVAERLYKTYTVMQERDAASRLEADQAQMALLRYRRDEQSKQAEYIENSRQITRTEAELIALTQAQRSEQGLLQRKIDETSQLLHAAIAVWRMRYLLTAPIAGRVLWHDGIGPHRAVAAGQALLQIVPAETEGDSVFAIVRLPVAGAGKVSIGMDVKLSLADYPEREYGLLLGTVAQIAPAPTLDATQGAYYKVHIRLPQQLRSSYRQPLAFRPNMVATARITTRDRSLLARFWDYVRADG